MGNTACLVLAYYIHDLSPFLVEFGNGIGLRWYGLAYVLAFAAAYGLFVHLARKGYSDIRPSEVGDFITGAALFGVILGGRLGYMLFYDWTNFIQDPLIFFKFWDGGMSSHGGILGVAIFTFIYARRKKIPWLNVGDSIVVSTPVGLFLGRCANFINGELYGRPTTMPWAVQFPKDLYYAPPEVAQSVITQAIAINPDWNSLPVVLDHISHSSELRQIICEIVPPRHPSQIYEGLLEGVFLFALMWILRTRFRLQNGVLTGVFFIAYALLRMVGEMFREPDAPLTIGLTRGQFLSLFMILMGVGFLAGSKWARTWPSQFR